MRSIARELYPKGMAHVVHARSARLLFSAQGIGIGNSNKFSGALLFGYFFLGRKKKWLDVGAVNKVRKCPWGAATGSAVRPRPDIEIQPRSDIKHVGLIPSNLLNESGALWEPTYK